MTKIFKLTIIKNVLYCKRNMRADMVVRGLKWRENIERQKNRRET